MLHKDQVEKYDGSISQLANDIGDLKYDTLAEFLKLLAKKIQEDGDKDQTRGRVKLARELHSCAHDLRLGKIAIDKAWEISKPFSE